MKKFVYIVLSLLAVSLIFVFGCDTPDKDNNKDKQITYPLPDNSNRKFSRDAHLKKDGIILPPTPDRIPPHLKSFPR